MQPKGDSNTTVSPSKKRRLSSNQPWGNALRGITSASSTGGSIGVVVMRLHGPQPTQRPHVQEKIKPAPSPTGNCGIEDQTAEHILQWCLFLQTARTNACPIAFQPYTHQTLRQQGGTGEGSYIHLADWTLSVATIEKKNKCPKNRCQPKRFNEQYILSNLNHAIEKECTFIRSTFSREPVSFQLSAPFTPNIK